MTMPTFSEYLDPESDLAHYGVKGMKWGVRKKQAKRNFKTAKRDITNKYYDDVIGLDLQVRDKTYRYNQKYGYDKAKVDARIKKEMQPKANRIIKEADRNYIRAKNRYEKEINSIREEKRNAVKGGRSYASDKFGTEKGKVVAAAFLAGPGATYGYLAAKGSGATSGKAAVSAFFGGPLGGALYRSIDGGRSTPYKSK